MRSGAWTRLALWGALAGNLAAASPETLWSVGLFASEGGDFRRARLSAPSVETFATSASGAFEAYLPKSAAPFEAARSGRGERRHDGVFTQVRREGGAFASGCREDAIERGPRGRYFSWDEARWQEAECDGGRIGFFAQCGWAPGDRREAARLEGGGVTLFGLIPERDADALGVGCVRVEFTDSTVRARDCATAIETFYSVQLCDWLRLTPDVQAIVRPGGIARDSVVFGLRVLVSW